MKERVVRAVESRAAALVDLLAEMVRTCSVNPSGETAAMAELVRREAGIYTPHVATVAVEEDRPNVVARINPRGRPILVLNSHMDTVPIGDRSQWSHDPLGAETDGTTLYGRGSADAKASLAAMLCAARVLVEERIPLKGEMVVTAVSDEEVGGAKGTQALLTDGHVGADYAVIGEITSNHLAVAEKGVINFEVVTRGRTAHASTPWAGENAINKMLALLQEIDGALRDQCASGSHPLTPPPSYNIGVIEGGVKINVVPDTCRVYIDRRTLPGESIEAAIEAIANVVSECRSRDPELVAELTVLRTGDAFETPADCHLVQRGQQKLRELGLPDKLVGYEQASDGRFFAALGIPTIIFGPGVPQQAHTPDEHIDTREVITAAKFYALLAADLLCPTT